MTEVEHDGRIYILRKMSDVKDARIRTLYGKDHYIDVLLPTKDRFFNLDFSPDPELGQRVADYWSKHTDADS